MSKTVQAVRKMPLKNTQSEYLIKIKGGGDKLNVFSGKSKAVSVCLLQGKTINNISFTLVVARIWWAYSCRVAIGSATLATAAVKKRG